MRDRIWIIAGLGLFVTVVTTPFWFAHPAAKDLGKVPGLTLPANTKECVAPASYMRTSHMQLLMSWREDVVRRDQRQYVAFNGKVYEKSLDQTCLGCHNKQEFCDRCHAYAGVSGPYCWHCHSQPQTTASAMTPGKTNVSGQDQTRIATRSLPSFRRSTP
jgi:[DsrC]-trisulfide reductase subunit J